MKKFLTALTLSVGLSFAGNATASDFPGWSFRDACSANDTFCVRFEQRARGQASGVWATVPPKIRSGCVSETAAVEKSYRLLYECLANKMQEHITGQARGPQGGEVVNLTPAFKEPAPPPPPPPPAPVAEPAAPPAPAAEPQAQAAPEPAPAAEPAPQAAPEPAPATPAETPKQQ